MQQIQVQAPVQGMIVPLAENPDPVFAQKMAGDGICVDPTSEEVRAPIAGELVLVHPSMHAFTIRSPEGIELLTHVGIDTMGLRGEGFSLLAEQGAEVKAGQAILRFNAAQVGEKARSLLTAVLVTNPERIARFDGQAGFVEASAPLMQLELSSAAAAPAEAAPSGDIQRSQPIILPNPSGLHARPAAVLANIAQRFSSQLILQLEGREANAKSVTSVMMLNTKKGDAITVAASGSDAEAALKKLSQLLADGCGEDLSAAAAEQEQPVAVEAPADGPEGALTGLTAAPGICLGQLFMLTAQEPTVPERGGSQPEEEAKLKAGVDRAAAELSGLIAAAGGDAKAKILKVQLSLLEDPDLNASTARGLAEGKSAAYAWRRAYAELASGLSALNSPLLKERAADVRDVGRRVLANLVESAAQTAIELPEGAIVVAEEILPSDMAAFDKDKLAGICTVSGSPTSHVSILARNVGVPSLCGIPQEALRLESGTPALLDADHGALFPDPMEDLVAEAKEQIAEAARVRAEELAAAHKPARTKDGVRIEVVANITSEEEAGDGLEVGAEGVGLLRSEFLFYERSQPPSEDEQARCYETIARALGKDRPFIIRTLDVGGDKPLDYLKLPAEQNPFLGLRGVRVSLAHLDLFKTQLKAIGRAAHVGNVHVMFPMISGLSELRRVKEIMAETLPDAQLSQLKIGAMIEVPAAAALADLLAEELDFFSVGTNDLTQYTLAIDRGHPVLAKQADALHPGVLRMIAMTTAGARKLRRKVAVCGGVASDPLAAPLLVGLGVTELSVSVPAIPTVKAALARWSRAECEALAKEVMQLSTTEGIRARLHIRSEEKKAK